MSIGATSPTDGGLVTALSGVLELELLHGLSELADRGKIGGCMPALDSIERLDADAREPRQSHLRQTDSLPAPSEPGGKCRTVGRDLGRGTGSSCGGTVPGSAQDCKQGGLAQHRVAHAIKFKNAEFQGCSLPPHAEILAVLTFMSIILRCSAILVLSRASLGPLPGMPAAGRIDFRAARGIFQSALTTAIARCASSSAENA